MASGLQNVGAAGLEGASTAMQVKTQKKQLALLDAQKWNTEEDTRLKRDQGFYAWMQGNRVRSEMENIHSATELNISNKYRVEVQRMLDSITYEQQRWLYGSGSGSPTRAQKRSWLMAKHGLSRGAAIAFLNSQTGQSGKSGDQSQRDIGMTTDGKHYGGNW